MAMWRRLSLPVGPGRTAMVAAAVAWVGALAGGIGFVAMLLGLATAAGFAVSTRRVVLGLLFGAAALSGWIASSRVEATLAADVPSGPARLQGVIADEPALRGSEIVFLLRVECRIESGMCVPVELPPLAVETISIGEAAFGHRVEVTGRVVSRPGRIRGDPVAARIVDAGVVLLPGRPNLLFALGNALRSRVTERLADRGPHPAAALMSGLLIGDTSAMRASDLDELRRSGLTHFVAVSGSNVALFLMAWWLLSTPLLRDPRLRSAWGLVGLGLFVVVTRWEASVVRASAMAGLVLAGRAVAVPVDAWTALGTAVAGLLLLSGDLATNVGFQLSVAATAGVLAGAHVFRERRPRLLWAALGATASAQMAVTPLLLIHFGTVPLLSPVANVLAAPLVTLATAAGGVGVLLGLDPLVRLGLVAADGVLTVAHLAAGWPQLGWAGVASLVGLGVALRYRVARPAAVVAMVVIAWPLLGQHRAPDTSTVTVLDVGQGDAILVQGSGGEVMLVDGGRDPRRLRAKLGDRNITRIDVLVVSHGDDDHLGGLVDLVGLMPIGEVWVPDQPRRGASLAAFVAAVTEAQIPIRSIGAADHMRLGEFAISVLGPKRRYADENDGSIVLLLDSGRHSMLLAGDIESVAQRDIDPPPVDVLLVPHHGSATSDRAWLRAVAPATAVVSVGPNNYGHPSPAVMTALAEVGADILSTRDVGDIRVEFP